MSEIIDEWVELTRRDLHASKLLLANEGLDAGAFHAQQAAEKMFKAALVLAGVHPPRTHNLTELDALLATGLDRPLSGAALLREVSAWAVSLRYELNDPRPSLAEVEAVVHAVGSFMARQGWA